MKKELQEELFAIAPEWFNRSNMKQSLMCFGFEVGDGWFNLLKDLLEGIKKCDVPEAFQVVQVKEKFGGLRFYTDFLSEEVDELIRKAENLSEETCDQCGSPGKANEFGYISVMCDPCRAEKALIIG